jgi:hypothetical protein
MQDKPMSLSMSQKVKLVGPVLNVEKTNGNGPPLEARMNPLVRHEKVGNIKYRRCDPKRKGRQRWRGVAH